MEHKTVSLADQVFDRLETDILHGKYQRGEILTEMELAEDLGVSRTPIREALRRLEQEHILRTGTRGIEVVGVNLEDIEDIYTVRLAIEGLAARYAAERATEAEIAELRETGELQGYYVERCNAAGVRGQDSEFHEMIYRLSGSMVLCDTLLPLHKKVQKYRMASVEDHDRAEASFAEHKAILDAIAAHDPDAAEAAMKRHVLHAKQHILGK